MCNYFGTASGRGEGLLWERCRGRAVPLRVLETRHFPQMEEMMEALRTDTQPDDAAFRRGDKGSDVKQLFSHLPNNLKNELRECLTKRK